MTVALRIGDRASRALRTAGPLRAVLVVGAADAAGNVRTMRRRVVLRA